MNECFTIGERVKTKIAAGFGEASAVITDLRWTAPLYELMFDDGSVGCARADNLAKIPSTAFEAAPAGDATSDHDAACGQAGTNATDKATAAPATVKVGNFVKFRGQFVKVEFPDARHDCVSLILKADGTSWLVNTCELQPA